MASKFGMAGGIPERRVRPIWDAIDSRQFKNALKLCASLLTKYPNSPYALALKALVVERMGKSDEALSICLNAKELLCTSDSIYIDDLTLSTLQIVFQRLDHLDLATSCYEHACGKFPTNLDLMMGLFNCHVREYSFVKQQQTALKMYKVVGEERFLLWAVCSIQLQVLCGNGGEKLLALAEGLLKKHIASHSLHEPEALSVYIYLLEQQSKFQDALEVISGKLGSLIMIEVDRLRLQGKLLARAGDYASAADVFQKVLGLCPDDWDSFLHYLGCLLEGDGVWFSDTDGSQVSPPLDCKLSHLTDEKFDSGISNASAFVQNLMASSSNDAIRSPYLAYLEIERRKLLFGKGDEDKIIIILMQYFSKFGHLACFNPDIKVFLQVLTPDKRGQFMTKLTEVCETPETPPLKALGMSISVYKAQEFFGNFFTLPSSDVETLSVQMVKLYFKNLPLSKDLDPQESMHGEELLSLASNMLVQLFWRTKNLGYLVEAIMLLEFGLTVRRFVWQYKILLLHLYSHWDALSLAYQWYKSLDVKNILLETLSHHILPQMLQSPLWVDLDDLLKDYLRFMDDHFRESADLTFLAYRHRNYSKVIEFVQFKERLQRSSHYLLAKLEAPILQLKQNANSIEEEKGVLESLNGGIDFLELSSEIRFKNMTFNEDFQSRPWWTPTCDKNYLLGPFEGVSYFPRENKHLMKQSEANVLKTIERKSLLPRMIYLSLQCASSSLKEHIQSNGSAITSGFSIELKALLECYVKFLGFSFQDATDLLLAISNGIEALETLSSDLIEWMNFAVFFNAWNLNTNEIQPDKETRRPDTWQMANTLLEKYILKKLKSIESLVTSPGCDLRLLVQLITEPLAWHILILQSCVHSSLPSGKKKKKGAPTEQINSHLSLEIKDSIQSICGVIEEVANWLREQIKRPVDANTEIILSSIRVEDDHEGPGKVFQVLENSISSIDHEEIGDRISQALKSWSSGDVAKKIVNGHSAVLSEFLRISELKLKALKALKLQI